MASEAIPVRGTEVLVLHAPPTVAFALEEDTADRITIRLVPLAAADTAAKEALLAQGASEQVVAFAQRVGLLDHLGTALAVARGCFPSARRWDLLAHERPAQLEIHVTVPGTAEEVYRSHAACVDRWVKVLPPEALGKLALTEAPG
jgi:hypothetical protein